MRLNYPDPFVPFAGPFPTGSGKPEFVSDRMALWGLDPVPAYTSSHEMSQRGAALAREFPARPHHASRSLLAEYFLTTRSSGGGGEPPRC
jgi:hypothetical protein